jgi:hypothetical protein
MVGLLLIALSVLGGWRLETVTIEPVPPPPQAYVDKLREDMESALTFLNAELMSRYRVQIGWSWTEPTAGYGFPYPVPEYLRVTYYECRWTYRWRDFIISQWNVVYGMGLTPPQDYQELKSRVVDSIVSDIKVNVLKNLFVYPTTTAQPQITVLPTQPQITIQPQPTTPALETVTSRVVETVTTTVGNVPTTVVTTVAEEVVGPVTAPAYASFVPLAGLAMALGGVLLEARRRR